MASDILHIKDGYYFEVPRVLWRSNRTKAEDFPAWFQRLDPDFQSWEADRILEGLGELGVPPATLDSTKDAWTEWQSSKHRNQGWPLDAYLDRQLAEVRTRAVGWAKRNAPTAKDPVKAYLANNPDAPNPWFFELLENPDAAKKWSALKQKVNSYSFLKDYHDRSDAKPWDAETLSNYNRTLDGKVLIPQPFGTLRNAYEAESGFCISRYMIIETIVAIALYFVFRWLARKVQSNEAPKGKSWNFLEGFVQAVRNNIVVPAMGEHDADRFMPFLWTMFFFILGCNLMGMIPWVGAPTASWGTTAALAILVFLVGLFVGVKTFGVTGYLKNIIPELGLPWYLAFWVVPLLWVIEFASLFIKHAVLSVRLLMNMGAGHLVLLGILGIGISARTALELSSLGWFGVAGISVLGTTVLSFLEVFVAFLQAYVFTFLAALFIGSSIHHH
jgi:F-type H+-transporting ATPase subunit a